MTSLNERIAEKKGWTEILTKGTGSWASLIGIPPEGQWHRPVPNYTGDLVLSDGLLEEIRAKEGYAVVEVREADGSDFLEVWNRMKVKTHHGTLGENRAEAWWAVFGD